MRHLEASPRVPLFVLNVLLQCGRPRVSPLLRHGPTSVSPLLRHGPTCVCLCSGTARLLSHILLQNGQPATFCFFLSLSLPPPLSFVFLFYFRWFVWVAVVFGSRSLPSPPAIFCLFKSSQSFTPPVSRASSNKDAARRPTPPAQAAAAQKPKEAAGGRKAGKKRLPRTPPPPLALPAARSPR